MQVSTLQKKHQPQVKHWFSFQNQLGFSYSKYRKQSELFFNSQDQCYKWNKFSLLEIEDNYKVNEYYWGVKIEEYQIPPEVQEYHARQNWLKIDLYSSIYRQYIKKNKVYAVSGYKGSKILAFSTHSTENLFKVLDFFDNPTPLYLEMRNDNEILHRDINLYNCYLKFSSAISDEVIHKIQKQFNIVIRTSKTAFICPKSYLYTPIKIENGEIIEYNNDEEFYHDFQKHTDTIDLYKFFPNDSTNLREVDTFNNEYTKEDYRVNTGKTDYFISNHKYFDAFQQEYGFDINALVTLFYNSPEYTASMKKYLGCKGKNESTTKKLLIEIFGRFIYEYYTNFQRHISPEVRLTTEKRSEWETGTNLNFDLLNQYGEYSNYTRIKNAIFNFLEKAGVILEYGKHSSLPNLSIKKRYLLKIIDKNNFYFNIYKLLESLFNQLLLIFKNNNLFDRTKHLLKILLCETFSEGNNGEIDTKCFVGTG